LLHDLFLIDIAWGLSTAIERRGIGRRFNLAEIVFLEKAKAPSGHNCRDECFIFAIKHTKQLSTAKLKCAIEFVVAL
jgi:hypothetical protein